MAVNWIMANPLTRRKGGGMMHRSHRAATHATGARQPRSPQRVNISTTMPDEVRGGDVDHGRDVDHQSQMTQGYHKTRVQHGYV